MLTKQDLNAIGKLVDSKLEEKLEKKLKPIHKGINKVQATLDTAIDHFDVRSDELKKAVKKTRSEAGFEEYNFIY